MNVSRTTALAGLLICSSAMGQNLFAVEGIPGISARPSVQIDLTPQMLNFVTAAAGASGDPQAAELLAGIERVRVRVYEQLDDANAVLGFVEDASSALESQGWQPAVSVQDGASRVQMYMQFEGEEVAGMTVMVVDETEAVFIDIAGTIDPATLGALTRQMGLNGVLDSVGGAALNHRPPAGAGTEADEAP